MSGRSWGLPDFLCLNYEYLVDFPDCNGRELDSPEDLEQQD